MKKYSICDLKVVKINQNDRYYYFICEYDNVSKTYIEIFTKEKFKNSNIEDMVELSEFYPVLGVCNFKTMKPLMLNKKELITKFIEINNFYNMQKKQVNITSKPLDDTLLSETGLILKNCNDDINVEKILYQNKIRTIKDLVSLDYDSILKMCNELDSRNKYYVSNNILGLQDLIKYNYYNIPFFYELDYLKAPRIVYDIELNRYIYVLWFYKEKFTNAISLYRLGFNKNEISHILDNKQNGEVVEFYKAISNPIKEKEEQDIIYNKKLAIYLDNYNKTKKENYEKVKHIN